MNENIWTVILSTIKDKKVIHSINNPKVDGRYLCTYLHKFDKNEPPLRYLQILYYDADKKYWHDVGHPSGLSHIILAWTDKVPVCDYSYSNFKIEFGIALERNTINEN